MWHYILIFLLASPFAQTTQNIAEMITNYAKVRTNMDKNMTLLSTTDNEGEELHSEYEDFDEIQEADPKSGFSWNINTLGKVIAGAISLMSLLVNEPKSSYESRQTRQNNLNLANSINNNFAEDRYNPTTATKQFKYYSGKTSYDADKEQYPSLQTSDMTKSQQEPFQKKEVTLVNSDPSLSYQISEDKPSPVYYSNHDHHPEDNKKPDYSYPWMSQQSTPQWSITTEQPNWGDISAKKPLTFWNPHQHDLLYEDHPDEHINDHPIDHEDRDSKRPYSYYFLGRKLWYVPLLFSAYFIIYIGALILKSLARHKIQLPEKIHELAEHDVHHGSDHRRRYRKLNQLTNAVHKSLNKSFS